MGTFLSRDEARETLAQGAAQDGSIFGWRRGRAARDTLVVGVGGGGYIVAPRHVGSVRTGWFHLMLSDSDRLAYLGPCSAYTYAQYMCYIDIQYIYIYISNTLTTLSMMLTLWNRSLFHFFLENGGRAASPSMCPSFIDSLSLVGMLERTYVFKRGRGSADTLWFVR
jgi:hypothetical protein